MDLGVGFYENRNRSPPVKVLSSQLREGNEQTGQNGKIRCTIKRLGLAKTTPLHVSVVWMQGTVLKVTSNADTTVLLIDETGTFTINGVNSIPKGKPCLSQGKYVMVMGVIQSCRPEPVLRAVKMTDLSGNDIHRKMWKLEVEDLQQTLE
ncbi:recQ-mediated genome instability protein 2 [Brienomyrus brachyistius]|uniref:recQ-mediated genome instability protein 2 n=1 Tax=Brienomyrus brachyistius TaxID=42636 RepID=UPI0020B30EE8|nr:recQ-mediated genome instability protein 2 [Brienomyrus brachyistius]